MRENRLRFSIRKLTIGAVSVMFGAVIFGLSANQVQAATDESNSAQASEISDVSNTDSETAENSTTASEKASAKTQENISTEKVNDDVTTAESQRTQQVDEAHQTPHTGEDFNKKYQEDIPPVIVPKNNKQSSKDTILKDANGTTTQFTISSTNKNTGKTASAKAGNSIENVFIDTTTASNTEVTYTVNNPTDSSQNISIFTEFPAWNGTHALIKVDSDRFKKDADGNIVFGGDYAQKGLTLDNFDLAISKIGSSGFGRSLKEASKNPALIGGFQITGTLAAGESASLVVPIKLNGTGDENGIVREKIGYFFGGGSDTRLVNVVTNLTLQKDKHYFLVDVDKSDTTHFRSVDQSILDDLAKNGVSPLYQDGDIKFNGTNWFGTVEDQQGDDQPIFVNDYIDISGAQNRLRKILNKYGYDIAGLGGLTEVSNSSYIFRNNYNYYDAQGNKIQLGIGNISNFMLGIKQVISLKDHQAPILNVNDSNYKTKLDNLFTDPSDSAEQLNVDSSNVDISKPGVYQVKVSNANGDISRTYNVVVASYNNPATTRVGEPNHKNISAEDMLSAESLQSLKDNGYTVSFAAAPSYTIAGQEPVELIITDAEGNTYKTTQDINIEQTVHVNLVNEDGTTVTSTYKNGTVGTSDKLNLLSELPEGYALAANENHELAIKFNASDDSVAVNIVQLKNESKTFTRTIHYQYADGKTAAD
ncbi:YSIRK-type signal peptide-containing protein, partial [Lactobacillus hamsteri]